jgi:predicted RNA-binding Zn-ribbon protein involved in translation (DUF1610 family)
VPDADGKQPVEVCPKCGSDSVERLVRMRRYTDSEWYRCDRCGHVYVKPATAPVEPP